MTPSVEALEKFLDQNQDREGMPLIAKYIRDGDEEAYSQLANLAVDRCFSDWRDCLSPLLNCTHFDLPAEADERLVRARTLALSYERPRDFAERVSNLCKKVKQHKADQWLDELFEKISPQRRKDQTTALISSADLTDKNANVTTIGQFALSRPVDDWICAIKSNYDDAPKVSGRLAYFFSTHSPDTVRENLEQLVSHGDRRKCVDEVALSCYRVGIIEAEAAAVTGIENCQQEFDRFLAYEKMLKVDFASHTDGARRAAEASLMGDPDRNNKALPMQWLAEHFPDRLAELSIEIVQDPALMKRHFHNHEGLFEFSMKTVGIGGGDTLLDACANSNQLAIVHAAVKGAIAGGYRPPNSTIDAMIRRLVTSGFGGKEPKTIEVIAEWNPDSFREELQTLANSEFPSIQHAANKVLADLDKPSVTKAEASDSELSVFQRLEEFCANRSAPDIYPTLKSQLLPCLRIRSIAIDPEKATHLDPETSQIGGLPLVGDGFKWPEEIPGSPLPFVARICETDWRKILPDFSGDLLFFAHWEEQTVAIRSQPTDGRLKLAKEPANLSYLYEPCNGEVTLDYCLPWPETDTAVPAYRPLLKSDSVSLQTLQEITAQFQGRGDNSDSAVHRALGYPRVEFMPIEGSTKSETDVSADADELISILSIETDEDAGIRFYDTGMMNILLTRKEWEDRDFSNPELFVDFS